MNRSCLLPLLHLPSLALLAAGCSGGAVDEPEATSANKLEGRLEADVVAAAMEPPAAARDACAQLDADAACSISIDGHSIEGTCRRGPGAADPLACAPAHLPPFPHRPPREALDACAQLDADAACSISIDGHSSEGTCRRGPGADDPLACAPAHLPPFPDRPPREALDACAALAPGAACGFDLRGQSLTGTCWSPDPRAPLACAPAGAGNSALSQPGARRRDREVNLFGVGHSHRSA